MKLVQLGLMAVGMLFTARAGYAQDDAEAIKKKILQEVEKRLKAEEERILSELSKIIDEELAKWKKGEKPSSIEPKKEEPKKEEPKKKEPAHKVRGFLGVSTQDLSEDELQDLGIDAGVRVADVVPESPAAQSGLQAEDVILKLDGKTVDSTQALRDIVAEKGAGGSLKVDYLQAGERKSLTVTLARHPNDPGDEPKVEEPKKDEPGEGELRERVKKFLDKEKDAPKAEKPKSKKKEEKSEEPSDDALALDDEMFEQIRPLLEQFGLNPEDYFEKGDDGKWRPGEQLREMFKQFDFRKFLPGRPEEEEEEEAPKPKKEKKPKKEEPKKEEKKVESVKSAWIGLVPAELSDEDRAELDLEGGVGLRIAEVLEGSPAASAGLEKGDILVRIDGKKVKGEEFLQKFVRSAKPGQECEIAVIRGGKELKKKLMLAERKE